MISKQLTNLGLLGFSLVFLISNGLNAQHWSVNNVAGSGEEIFAVDLPPLETGFPFPGPITKDGDGNIYFSASNAANTSISGVYKMDPEFESIEMILDGVVSITGVAIDNAGNIYFSKGAIWGGVDDGYSSEYIYYINVSDGSIDTIAGNGYEIEGGAYPEEGVHARETPIGNAGGLKVREEGGQEYLYYSATISDNNFIQKINLETNLTYRVAGIPHTLDEETYVDVVDGADALTSYINLSIGIGWDSNGNLYFNTGATGDGAYSIKKIVDGKIYHVAGNDNDEYTGDGGSAALAGLKNTNGGFVITDSNELIFCDASNYVVRKIVLSGTTAPDGLITTVCGTGYNEGDTDNPEGDLSNGTFKLAIETNMRPLDILYTDVGFIMTDGNHKIRRVANCFNPEITSTSIDKSDICKGDIVTLSFDGSLNDGLKWEWYKGECFVEPSLGNGTSLQVVADENVSYFVVGWGGCTNLTAAECTEIVLDVACKEYFNTFTPNDDGKNDFLEIPVLENFPKNTVIIYNRWGDILKQIENYDNETSVWRGTNEGNNPVDSGTYFFTAESDGKLITSGWIELIK